MPLPSLVWTPSTMGHPGGCSGGDVWDPGVRAAAHLCHHLSNITQEGQKFTQAAPSPLRFVSCPGTGVKEGIEEKQERNPINAGVRRERGRR